MLPAIVAALSACRPAPAPPPDDSSETGCLSFAGPITSGRYPGAPVFAEDLFLAGLVTATDATLARTDVSTPEPIPATVTTVPGAGTRFYPTNPLAPGSRIGLLDASGCLGVDRSVHPAGLPVDPADVHGRTWALRDAVGFSVISTPGRGDDLPSMWRLRGTRETGPWPWYLHADVEGPTVRWSLAPGAQATGLPDPCVMPTPVSPAAPFDSAHPTVSLDELPNLTLGADRTPLTFFSPRLRFIVSPAGASLALVRLTGAVDPLALASTLTGLDLPDATQPLDPASCPTPLGAPEGAAPPPCVPCEAGSDWLCEERTLTVLEATAVDVAWPSGASIAADPACQGG